MAERGRPTLYTDEVADEVLRRMAEGETLRAVCRDEHLPAASTIRGWVVEDREGFSERYARARLLQLDHWADEVVSISDDGENDTYETDEGPRVNYDHIQRSKLRVDSRKWLLGKLHPEYMDRQRVEHTGKDGGPIEHSDLTDEERADRIAGLLERARARRDGGAS